MIIKPLNTSRITALLLLHGLAGPASALTMQFGDNGTPAASFPSSINASAFTPGEELRFLASTGGEGGGLPPHGMMLGIEAWVFDDITGEMTGVVNTATTLGLNSTAISYIDAGSIPPSGDQNGGPGIAQNATYFGAPFGFLAPIVGSGAGNLYGAATLAIIDATSFTVHFPVLEGQWNGFYFSYGSATGGITFNCTGAPDANFHCTMEHLIDAAEDPAVVGLFSVGWALQMELVSAPIPLTAAISVPGGTPQECTGPAGEIVTLDLVTTLPAGVAIASIDWTVDGASAGSTTSITPTLSVGNHTVRVDVVGDNGTPVSDTVNVVVQDTVPPDVNPVVTDAFTGQPVTVLTKITSATQSFFNVSDACDANPSVQGTMGKALVDGDYAIIGRFGTGLNLFSAFIDLTVTATDASGNTATGITTLSAP